MSLTTAAILSLALQCAPSVDPRMLAGIGQQESAGDPLALHVNKMPPGWLQPRASTTTEAAHIAAQYIAAGYSVDLGLMQVNSRNLDLLGLGLADAFDACRSVSAAAKLIEMMSRYNTGRPHAGIQNGYAPAVIARMHAIKVADTPSAPPVPEHPPCPADDEDGWHTVARQPGCTSTKETTDNEDK